MAPETEPGQLGEELQDGEWQPSPRSDELENASDADLEKAIRDKAAQMERERHDKVVERAQPKEEAPPEPEGQEETPEQPAEPAEPEAGKEAASAEPEAAHPQDDLRQELELERLRRERLEAEVRRANYQRDNFAGEIGNLKRLLSKPPQPKDESVYDAEPARPAPVDDDDRRELRQELSDLRQERVQAAISSVVSNFEANVVPKEVERFDSIWGKDAGKDLRAKMEALVAQRAPDYRDDLTGSNPKRATIALETLLKGALVDAQIETITARREAVQRERAQQAEALKARKQDADMAGRGRTSAATKPARAKTPDELTDAELENAIQRAVVQEYSSRGR